MEDVLISMNVLMQVFVIPMQYAPILMVLSPVELADQDTVALDSLDVLISMNVNKTLDLAVL